MSVDCCFMAGSRGEACDHGVTTRGATPGNVGQRGATTELQRAFAPRGFAAS